MFKSIKNLHCFMAGPLCFLHRRHSGIPMQRILLLCALKRASSTYAMILAACIAPGRHSQPGFTWTAPTTGKLLSRGVKMMCMRPLNTRLRTAICTSSQCLHRSKNVSVVEPK